MEGARARGGPRAERGGRGGVGHDEQKNLCVLLSRALGAPNVESVRETPFDLLEIEQERALPGMWVHGVVGSAAWG